MQALDREKVEAVERMQRAIDEKEQLQRIHGVCEGTLQKKELEVLKLKRDVGDLERTLETSRCAPRSLSSLGRC